MRVEAVHGTARAGVRTPRPTASPVPTAPQSGPRTLNHRHRTHDYELVPQTLKKKSQFKNARTVQNFIFTFFGCAVTAESAEDQSQV